MNLTASFPKPRRLAVCFLAFLCTAFTTAAWADPPGRVGRLGDMSGQVWFFSPDSGEWVSAVRNRPLTDGDRLSTDAGARAEVRIGSSTVRLDSGTELEVLRIDDGRISLQLHSGSIAARLRTGESAREFELRTGEGRFTTLRAGRYRFDRADEASHVTVLSGSALFEGPGSALTVNAGQRAEFWLENNAAQYSITEPVRDAFASWSADQDRRDDRSASARYVSPEMTGAEDLDRYGRWEQEPEYGAVWIPRAVPVGWAPYRAGHWAWVSPWGWTWIDDQPWGFAPFHYGRWVTVRDRWCWVPGTYVRRPVYAPALVGWVGGPHLSVSISVGNTAPAVGWFPLAPREIYVPSYRVSPTYVRQVNVTQVTNITNITTIVNNPQQAVVNVDYRNRHLPHAVTVVPQTVLVNRQPVAPAVLPWHQPRAIAGPVTLPANLQQQPVVVAPPVPAPSVDETRRRHGFAPGGQRPAPGLASPQARTPSPAIATGIAPGGGINIPPPPNRAIAPPAVGGADGEHRARFERGFDRNRREGRDDGRVQTLPAQSSRPMLMSPTGQPAVVQGQPTPQQAEAARQQEAQRQQQEAAMRAEQQRLMESRRQQEAQRQQQQQDAQRAQEAQRQQQEAAMRAEQQRQMEARRQQEAQRQQQEAAVRAEQQRQVEVRRHHELQQMQQKQQEAQRQQEQRVRVIQQQPQPPQPQPPQPQAAKPPAPEQKAGKPEPVQNAAERQQGKEERQQHGHPRGERREAN